MTKLPELPIHSSLRELLAYLRRIKPFPGERQQWHTEAQQIDRWIDAVEATLHPTPSTSTIDPKAKTAAVDAYIGLLATPATGDIEGDIDIVLRAYEEAKACGRSEISDVRVKNVLERLNLERADIAELLEGATIACNITTLRQAAALIKDMAAAKPVPVSLADGARAMEGMGDHPEWEPQKGTVNSARSCAKAWGLTYAD